MTRLRSLRPAFALVAVLAATHLAHAQSPTPATTPKTPAQPAKPTPAKPAPASARTTAARPAAWHINAYGLFALQQFAAKDSFDAVFGHSSKGMFGGGAQIWHRSGLFVQGEYSKVQDDGQRVFVNGGTVFPLGIPVHVELGMLDVGIGYKFVRKVRAPKAPAAPKPPAAAPSKKGDHDGVLWQSQPARPAAPAAAPARPGAASRFRLTPYLAAGFGRMSYTERGDFAASGENVSGSHNSYHALVGVEIPVMKWIGLDVEGFYRWVPDALGGDNSVSGDFDETDLGGPALRVKLTVGR